MRITVRTDNNPTINIQNPSPVVSIVEAGKYKGDQVELQVNSTHIQWRYAGGTTWTNLVALSVLTGETGNGISGVALTNTNGKIKTYTITFTDETTTTFQVVDGNDGTNGDDGHTPVITFVGTTIYVDGVAGPNLKGATGAAGVNGTNGDDGVGISDIEYTETVGLVDYYTIILSDSSTYQFTVTNGEKGDDGKGITSITLTNTEEKTKTYTITFTDNSTTTFDVIDGNDATVNATNIESVITGLTADTLDDNSIIAFVKSTLKSITWANIVTTLKNILQTKTLYFSNKTVAVGDWVSDTTYTDYGYKAVITCANVTSTMLSEVTFAPTESDFGNFASVCLSGTGTVTIYAKSIPSGTITIPTIKAEVV